MWKFTMYFWIIFGMTIFPFLQISSMNFLPPREYLVCYFACFVLSFSCLSFCWYLYIIWYVSGEMPLSNLSSQYISNKYSLVFLRSVTSELIYWSLLKASNASLLCPFIYLIVVTYSSNMKCQRNTLYVLKS